MLSLMKGGRYALNVAPHTARNALFTWRRLHSLHARTYREARSNAICALHFTIFLIFEF